MVLCFWSPKQEREIRSFSPLPRRKEKEIGQPGGFTDKANKKCFLAGCAFIMFILNEAPSPSLSLLQAAEQEEERSCKQNRQRADIRRRREGKKERRKGGKKQGGTGMEGMNEGRSPFQPPLGNIPRRKVHLLLCPASLLLGLCSQATKDRSRQARGGSSHRCPPPVLKLILSS